MSNFKANFKYFRNGLGNGLNWAGLIHLNVDQYVLIESQIIEDGGECRILRLKVQKSWKFKAIIGY